MKGGTTLSQDEIKAIIGDIDLEILTTLDMIKKDPSIRRELMSRIDDILDNRWDAMYLLKK